MWNLLATEMEESLAINSLMQQEEVPNLKF